jgi:preprotein translocase subunit SecE
MARKPSGPPPKSKRPAPTSTKTVAASNPPVAAPAGRAALPDAPRPSFNPIRMITGLPRFALEVRAEARKITWTSWRETWITSMMVFMMVFITAIFFLIVDQILSHAMQFLLQLAA